MSVRAVDVRLDLDRTIEPPRPSPPSARPRWPTRSSRSRGSRRTSRPPAAARPAARRSAWRPASAARARAACPGRAGTTRRQRQRPRTIRAPPRTAPATSHLIRRARPRAADGRRSTAYVAVPPPAHARPGCGREHLDRDVPRRRRPPHDLGAAGQHLLAAATPRPRRRSPRTGVSTSFSHSIRSRPACSSSARSPDALPQQPHDDRHARDRLHQRPMRSGSPTNGSAPAAAIASTRDGDAGGAAHGVARGERARARAPGRARRSR